MSRYEKVFNSKIVKVGLPLLAGWLVLSEGYLWWQKLSRNAARFSDATLQGQDTGEVVSNLDSTSSDGPSSALELIKLAAFESVPNVPDGTFEYGGSTTWAPIRKAVDSEVVLQLPGFQLKYANPTPESGRTPGSGTGIRMLLDGELIFSQSSRSLKDKEKAEALRHGYSLEQVAVAIDGIAVAVNPSLDIPGLTIAQLQKIYTGQVQNWREVGGPDLAITAYSRSVEDAGTVEFFVEDVLEEAQFSPNVQFVEDTTAGIRQVATDEGGIYYASAPEVVGQCLIKPLPLGETSAQYISPYQPPYVEPANCPRYRNRLNFTQFQNREYPITRELFVIVKKNGQIEEQVGAAYTNLLLTDQGQNLIESAGFVGAGELVN